MLQSVWEDRTNLIQKISFINTEWIQRRIGRAFSRQNLRDNVLTIKFQMIRQKKCNMLSWNKSRLSRESQSRLKLSTYLNFLWILSIDTMSLTKKYRNKDSKRHSPEFLRYCDLNKAWQRTLSISATTTILKSLWKKTSRLLGIVNRTWWSCQKIIQRASIFHNKITQAVKSSRQKQSLGKNQNLSQVKKICKVLKDSQSNLRSAIC